MEAAFDVAGRDVAGPRRGARVEPDTSTALCSGGRWRGETAMIGPNRSTLALCAALALAAAGGCEGGGSDGDGGFGGAPGGGEANGPLFGKLVTTDGSGGALYGVDLASGRFARLRGSAELAARGYAGGAATLTLERDRASGGAMLGTVSRCEGDAGLTCVLFLDDEGRVDSSLRFRSGELRTFKSSLDGRHLAAMEYRGSFSAGTTLMVMDRDGNVTAASNQYGYEFGAPYDWLREERLVYSVIDSEPAALRLSEVLDPAPAGESTLAARHAGTIEHVATSPDGLRAAMTVSGGDSATGRTVYRRPVILDLETAEMYEPIATPPGEALNAQYATFSPDGRWLLFLGVERSVAVGPAPSFPDVPTSPLFAVRVDGESRPLPRSPEESSAGARMIRMVPAAELDWQGGPSTYPTSDPLWLP